MAYSIFFNFRVGCALLLSHQKVSVWKRGDSIQIDILAVQKIQYPRSNRLVMAIC